VRNTPISRRTAASLLLLTGSAALLPPRPASASASNPARGGDDDHPPYDFTDAYYRSNGVLPSKLVGRRNGTDGISVFGAPPDSRFRNVRSLLTLPAYDLSGKHWYFTVLADLAVAPFTANAAGRRARALAEQSVVYVFPVRGGDPTGVGNSRQADMIDLSGGYFSGNPLGLWVHVFVNWTAKAFDTTVGRNALRALALRNGRALDGTPVIRTESELEDLTRAGLVTRTRRPTDVAGRWFVCPVIKDPRDGNVAPDALLVTVRRPDGTPLPAEQSFVTDFESLRRTGDYPH